MTGWSKAGFLLDFGDDDSGLFLKYLRPGLGLLHRCRRLGSDRQWGHQAENRAGGGNHARRLPGWKTDRNCPPT